MKHGSRFRNRGSDVLVVVDRRFVVPVDEGCELALLLLEVEQLVLDVEAGLDFLVHGEELAVDFGVLLLLPVLDALDLLLHEEAVLLDFPRHFVEERVLAVHCHVEDSFFDLGESVVMPIEILIQDKHSLAVFLRDLDDGLEESLDHVTHADLEVQPHELVSGHITMLLRVHALLIRRF